jgi:hypothetical protein
MMAIPSNWKSMAVCTDNYHPEKWVSYDLEDIAYAKDGCSKCSVRIPCLSTAIMNDSFVGVVAGISEYDYLELQWKRAMKEDESNWRTDDSVLPRLLQKAQ